VDKSPNGGCHDGVVQLGFVYQLTAPPATAARDAKRVTQ
jgi:hypothetical protein